MTVVRLVALADGRDHPDAGRWLESWDLDAYDGRGRITATDDLARAYRFADAREVMTLWRSASKVRPLRPDGKPNRPLTAFTIEVLSVRDDETAEPVL